MLLLELAWRQRVAWTSDRNLTEDDGKKKQEKKCMKFNFSEFMLFATSLAKCGACSVPRHFGNGSTCVTFLEQHLSMG